MTRQRQREIVVPIDPRTLLSEYDSRSASYEDFRRICETLLVQLLRREGLEVHSVTSRLKSRLSLATKLGREGKNYQGLGEVTDLVGLRVITHFEDEVDRIGKLIEREFAIDSDRSIDKRKILDPDRFGYLSLHFVCGLNQARMNLTENHGCRGLVCEIQVRSILQHAWAEIEHDLGYKAASTLPPHIQRRFSRLAGLLEIGDAEFSRLREDIRQYGAQVAAGLAPGKRSSSVSIDQISLDEFIRKDRTLRAVDKSLAQLERCSLKGVMNTEDTVAELHHVGITTLDDLRAALAKRREFLAFYWSRGRMMKYRHVSLPHGVAIWQLFQAMVAERETIAGAHKVFDAFGVGSPSERLSIARNLARQLALFRKVVRRGLPEADRKRIVRSGQGRPGTGGSSRGLA